MKRRDVYAFIDSQNLYLGIKRQGWKLDFFKFRKYLTEKYHVKRAFLFLGYIKQNQNLYRMLSKTGYNLVFKPTLRLKNGKVKGNVDAELVLYTMKYINSYRKALLVSGDGDFYCLVDYLSKKEKLERLLVPDKDRYSSLLKHFAVDKLDFMNNLKNKLEKESGRQLHKD